MCIEVGDFVKVDFADIIDEGLCGHYIDCAMSINLYTEHGYKYFKGKVVGKIKPLIGFRSAPTYIVELHLADFIRFKTKEVKKIVRV